MTSKSSNYWMNFFLAASLPQTVATKYAVIFTDHRIQENMLGDLTKDMLYDMGIKTMGDVIAILKHAKEVNDEKIQCQLLGKANLMVSTTKPKVTVASVDNKKPISGPSVSSSTSSSSVRTNKRLSMDSETETGQAKIRRVISSVTVDRNSTGFRARSPQTKVTFNSLKGVLNSRSSTNVGKSHQDERKVSVFNRLSGTDQPSSSPTTIRITATKEPKVTRTITGLNNTVSRGKTQSTTVKERLGVKPVTASQKPIKGNKSNRTVVSSTIKSKQIQQQQARNKISLKKSIFDRLGPNSF